MRFPLLAIGAVALTAWFALPLFATLYVADAKNECETSIQNAINLPARGLEKHLEKTINDGCARMMSIGETVERVGG